MILCLVIRTPNHDHNQWICVSFSVSRFTCHWITIIYSLHASHHGASGWLRHLFLGALVLESGELFQLIRRRDDPASFHVAHSLDVQQVHRNAVVQQVLVVGRVPETAKYTLTLDPTKQHTQRH